MCLQLHAKAHAHVVERGRHSKLVQGAPRVNYSPRSGILTPPFVPARLLVRLQGPTWHVVSMRALWAVLVITLFLLKWLGRQAEIVNMRVSCSLTSKAVRHARSYDLAETSWLCLVQTCRRCRSVDHIHFKQ